MGLASAMMDDPVSRTTRIVRQMLLRLGEEDRAAVLANIEICRNCGRDEGAMSAAYRSCPCERDD
jgi:hypothetical protein